MALRPLASVAVAFAVMFAGTDAHAQLGCSPRVVNTSPTCGNGSCSTPCDALLGEFAYFGLAMFPQGAGLHVGGGMLYQYPVGIEAAVQFPATTGPVTRSFFLGGLYARIRLLKEGLSGPWEHGTAMPDAAFLLTLRVGLGMAVGPSKPFGLALGPSGDFIFGGLFLVALRPMIFVQPAPREGRSILGLDVLPMFDISVGAVPPGALH